MSQGVLKAEGVCKSYGKKQVLHDLDLTIEPGKIYGLIGRNGVGKTTLLGILTGQNTKNSGTVTYDGAPVWENREVLRSFCFSRELSPTIMLGQNNMRVKDYIRAAECFLPRWDRDYARRLQEEFRVEGKKRICQLSKGQMSMVTILLALASRAPLTILDEPAAGLDVVARERLYRLLLEDYAETNRTFIVSTHIIEEAAGIFERVVIMDDGRIIENCPTEELVAQFAYVTGLQETVERVSAGMTVLQTQLMGRRATCTVRGDMDRLRAAARGEDVDLQPMNLQKVFVALCGHGDQQ